MVSQSRVYRLKLQVVVEIRDPVDFQLQEARLAMLIQGLEVVVESVKEVRGASWNKNHAETPAMKPPQAPKERLAVIPGQSSTWRCTARIAIFGTTLSLHV